MRRRIVALVWVALMASTPQAMAGPPVGGCPTPEWELREDPGHANTDLNGDGL